MHAFSDPAAEEKMRRTLGRGQAAIQRARAHAAAMDAYRTQQPQQPEVREALKDHEAGSDSTGVLGTVEHEGSEYLTVDLMADACSVHPGTVRKWIKKGRVKAKLGRLPGDRVDRWLIALDQLTKVGEAK